jgi:hypothetical protein
MGLTNNIEDILHRIKVYLYPNYLPKAEGRYIARTENEASLNVSKICAAMKNRGGYTGSYDNLVENIRLFLDECAYQLCDGYRLNLKYYSIHPTVSGTFDSEKEAHDSQKNPIRFNFRTNRKLRDIKEHIAVEILGVADVNAFIDQFIDRDAVSVNDLFVKDDMFCITGAKIKVAGNDPACGVYFVPVDDPDAAVRVTRIGENTSTKITGIAPATGYEKNKIEIRTQYTGSSVSFLKTPRTITSRFVLSEA